MTNVNVEQYAKNHIGWFQVLQTVIGGLILAAILSVYHSQDESNRTANDLGRNLAVMKGAVDNMQQQLSNVNQIPAALARIETKLDEHERRIHEIEQTRRLK